MIRGHPRNCPCIICKNQRGDEEDPEVRAARHAAIKARIRAKREAKGEDIWKYLLGAGIALKLIWLAFGGPGV